MDPPGNQSNTRLTLKQVEDQQARTGHAHPRSQGHTRACLLSCIHHSIGLHQLIDGTISRSIAKYTPLPVRSNASTNSDNVPAALTGCQELVRCLLWISGCTRPDVLYAASYLSRFVASPTDSHRQLALQVVSYLVHTRTLGITLGGTARNLEMYVDADWGGCRST